MQPFTKGGVQSDCKTVFGSVPAPYSAKIWSKSPLTALIVAKNATPRNSVRDGLHVPVPLGLHGVTLPGGRVEFQPENKANNVNCAGVFAAGEMALTFFRPNCVSTSPDAIN